MLVPTRVSAENTRQQCVDPAAPVETLTRSLLLAAYCELCLERSDPLTALQIADRLIAWAETASGPGVVTRLAKLRGEALAAAGQTAAADIALRAAAEAAREQAAWPLLWRIDRSLGKLLQAQRKREEAEQRYAAARAVVAELAATLPDDLRDGFQTRALAAIPAPQPHSSSRAAAAAYGGLTTRERQVAALIGRGLSNAQIAEHLVVS